MKHCYDFEKEIFRWDEGIPLGNGQIGALLWGKPQDLRVSLDRSDIWDTTPCPETKKAEFSYSNMVKLAKEGNLEEIRRIFDGPYNHLIPSKLPVGALVLHLPGKWKSGKLCLEEAMAKASGEGWQLQSFMHAKKRAGLIEISHTGSFTWELEHPAYNTEPGSNEGLANSVDTASLQQLRYEKARTGEKDGVRFFIQKITDSFSYGVFAAECRVPGKTLLAYTVGAVTDGYKNNLCNIRQEKNRKKEEDQRIGKTEKKEAQERRETDLPEAPVSWIEASITLLKEVLAKGYEENLRHHKKWWEDYFSKSSISLPDAFFEKNWYMAAYLLGSCSRKGGYPMPLQGLWTADDGKLPPWKGDYHHDLNTELSYYSYLKSNHIEEGECFLDFLWSLRGVGAQFAKSFYRAKGACIPATMTIDGQPLGGWGMYSLSPIMSAWLSQAFERHYRYTGDEEFLRKRAYPYMRDTGIFLESLLQEKNGLLYLPISSSPEIHDDTLEAFLTPNSNFDLALLHNLYESLEHYAAILENGEKEHWREIREKLPALSVDERGVLRLSPTESLRESHRHFSHLMAIHPLRLLTWDKEEDRKIIEACILDLEALGKGAWVGYSFGWMAQLYAIAKNGNAAAWQLRVFWESFCSDNGFHLNGDFKNRGITASHYRPFTLEANMCAADALQEMLLYSEKGEIEVFPAIPEEWAEKEVVFENLRAEKGILVSAVLNKGCIERLELIFEKPGCVYVKKNKFLTVLSKAEKNMKTTEDDCGWHIEGGNGEKAIICG